MDVRAKGARTESTVRDLLRKYTKLQWERVPGSGALDPKHMLKGDLYIPNCNNKYCVEVKGYAEDHINSSILTSVNPQLLQFWEQTTRQGIQVNKEPLLIFKFDRSKVFVAFNTLPNSTYPFITIERDNVLIFVALLEHWMASEKPIFTK